MGVEDVLLYVCTMHVRALYEHLEILVTNRKIFPVV